MKGIDLVVAGMLTASALAARTFKQSHNQSGVAQKPAVSGTSFWLLFQLPVSHKAGQK
jgi:hypothetical protein